MFLFCSSFVFSNVPDNKYDIQKWCVLFLTYIKLVVHVLACTQAITHIKWRRLDFVAILTSHNSPTPISLILLAQLQAYNDFRINQILKVICSIIALIKNLKFLQFCYLGWQVLILKSLNCARKKDMAIKFSKFTHLNELQP